MGPRKYVKSFIIRKGDHRMSTLCKDSFPLIDVRLVRDGGNFTAYKNISLRV